MRCEGCDRELPEGAKFCATCGTPVPGLERAAELVQMARTSGLAQPMVTANVPAIPEPAPLPAEQLSIAKPAAIPEPAPLPGEALPDLGTPAMPAPGMTWQPSSSEARETLERYQREAAELLSEDIEEESEERFDQADLEAYAAMATARHGQVGDLQYGETTPLPPPPLPPEEERVEHVAIGERSLTAPMVRPRERRRVRGDLLADSIRPRTAEEVREDGEPTGGKCCAYGCVTLAILLALFMLGMLWLQQAEERTPPPSARAPAAVERVIAQAVDASAAASEVHRGMMPDARERQHAYSPSPTDGRTSDHVLHELRQGDA